MTLRSATYAYVMKRPSRKRKMRRNCMFEKYPMKCESNVKCESKNSTNQQSYYYPIDKPYVTKDLGDI